MEALQKRMRTADEIIKKNNETLRAMEGKVKNCISQVNSLQKLNKGQTILFRQFKDHEIKITENHCELVDKIRQINESYEAMTEDNEKRDTKIEDLDAVCTDLIERNKKLEEGFKNTKNQLNTDFVKYEGKIGEKLLEFQKQLEVMPSQIVQGVSSIRKMHIEIKEKMTQTFKDFNA